MYRSYLHLWLTSVEVMLLGVTSFIAADLSYHWIFLTKLTHKCNTVVSAFIALLIEHQMVVTITRLKVESSREINLVLRLIDL